MDASHEQALTVAVPVTDEAVLKTLPTGPPEIHRLEFTQRGEGWPPSVSAGSSSVRPGIHGGPRIARARTARPSSTSSGAAVATSLSIPPARAAAPGRTAT